MKLTWLGHSCYALEQDGYRIVVDPYADTEGYADLRTSANGVYCSHHHFDHDAVGGVELLSADVENPFTVRTVATFHDEEQGALRGENIIHIFTAGGVSVAHLGDLGHQLSAEQLSAIGKVDGVLVPVGGVFTVDAAGAKQVCDAIDPKWIIPMHYYHPPYDFAKIATVDDFLALCDNVQHLDGAELTVDAGTKGVLVLKFNG